MSTEQTVRETELEGINRHRRRYWQHGMTIVAGHSHDRLCGRQLEQDHTRSSPGTTRRSAC